MPHRQPLIDSLPGLLHRGLGGRSVTGGAGCRGFRLSRPGGAPLDLKSIRLEGADPAGVGALSVTSSANVGTAWRRETAGGFRSAAEGAFWQVTFEQPGTASLWLLAQPGARATASYDLAVETLGEGGAADDPLAERALRARLADFAALAWAMPDLTPETAAVIAAAEAAIGDGDGASGPRERLLTRLVESVEGLVGAGLAARLAATGPLVPWLIDKSAGPADADGAALRIEATALLFAEVVLRRGAVRRPMLSEFGLVIDQPRAMYAIETRVSDLVARAGGDPRLQPILFRKHTLSGSRLRAEAGLHLDAMDALVGALAAMGIEAALGYGTLLGAVRERDFIDHDDDIDLLVALEPGEAAEQMGAVREGLEARGFDCRVFGDSKLPIVQASRGEGPAIDLFPVAPRGAGEVAVYLHKLKPGRVARDIVLPFSRIDFLGQSFRAPADPEAFLEVRYGADWRTPVRWTSRAGAP